MSQLSILPPAKRFLLGTVLAALPFTCLAVVVSLTTHPLPRVLARSVIAPDFAAIETIDQRKVVFFEFFAPLISEQNARIRRNRERLLDIDQRYRQTEQLTPADRATIRRLAGRYEVDLAQTSIDEQLARLLRRMDEIPVSLALAQAAAESAWGTSRFAADANNYFGQWCFREGCGVVPAKRDPGASHEVARFADARAAVDAYFRNINTHRAYRPLREIRATLRAARQPLNSKALLAGMSRYSERGPAYIKEILEIIEYNNLTERDQ